MKLTSAHSQDFKERSLEWWERPTPWNAHSFKVPWQEHLSVVSSEEWLDAILHILPDRFQWYHSWLSRQEARSDSSWASVVWLEVLQKRLPWTHRKTIYIRLTNSIQNQTHLPRGQCMLNTKRIRWESNYETEWMDSIIII